MTFERKRDGATAAGAQLRFEYGGGVASVERGAVLPWVTAHGTTRINITHLGREVAVGGGVTVGSGIAGILGLIPPIILPGGVGVEVLRIQDGTTEVFVNIAGTIAVFK